MAERPPNTDFNYSNMDWEQYMAHRPAYPAQLYNLVSEYHRAHGGKFDTALDVGGGIGIIAREFLVNEFTHVTLSDLSDTYISQAKDAFASAPDPSQMSFVTRKIEDLKPSDLPKGPVDLSTAGTCLHWADSLQVVPSASRLIAPGGTFSAWTYGPQNFPAASNPAAQAAFAKISQRMIDLYELKVEKLTESGPLANMNARFDNLHFDPKEWKNVRRIQVNPERPMFGTSFPAAESRVLSEIESQEVLQDTAFINRKADYEWMVGYVQSLIPPIDVKANMAAELAELKAAVGDGEIELIWPFALVLATRR